MLTKMVCNEKREQYTKEDCEYYVCAREHERARATKLCAAFVLSKTANMLGAASSASSACSVPPARRSSKCMAELTSQAGLLVVDRSRRQEDKSTSSSSSEPAWAPRPLHEDGLRRRAALRHQMPGAWRSGRALKMGV